MNHLSIRQPTHHCTDVPRNTFLVADYDTLLFLSVMNSVFTTTNTQVLVAPLRFARNCVLSWASYCAGHGHVSDIWTELYTRKLPYRFKRNIYCITYKQNVWKYLGKWIFSNKVSLCLMVRRSMGRRTTYVLATIPICLWLMKIDLNRTTNVKTQPWILLNWSRKECIEKEEKNIILMWEGDQIVYNVGFWC